MPTPPIVPPVDLNQPVTNPALMAALAYLVQTDTPETRQQVMARIQQATYLVAAITDELHTEPGATPGQVTIKAGSHFGLLTCDDQHGGQLLPLFTDWDAIRRWATNPVSGLVMPAADAWAFALADSTYSGVIINPADRSIILWRNMLERMAPAK